MKLVPDAVSSRLGKIPIVGKVLPFGDSADDEATEAPAATPQPAEPAEPSQTPEAQSESESPGPETAEYSVESEIEGDGADADDEQNTAEADDKQEAVAAASADEGDSNETETITAPSIGPNTVIDHTPPEERLDQDKISNTDVLGLDKRREVVGKRYSASPARQLVAYGLFVVVVVAIVIGGKALATNLDKPDAKVKDQAPWTGTQRPVRQLDFPQYGQPAS